MAKALDPITPLFGAPEQVTIPHLYENMNFGVEGRVIVHLVGIDE